MKKKRVIKIVNIVLVTVFVIASFNIGKIYYDYNKADNTYENLQDEYVAANEELFVPDVALPSSHTDIPLWKREFLGDYPQE